MQMPICKWKSTLDDWRSNGLGGKRHNDNYKTYIKDLQERNWPVCDKSARLLNKGPSELLAGVFRDSSIKPDRMQEAIAIFAIASLHKRPKQLWQIVSGQGKSRIIATVGLVAID